jgi:uncharacterized protein YecE (DUF72 family)
MPSNRTIKVGCCGFSMAMEKYFDQFRLVEVQKTFYRPPRRSTAERWRDSAPPEFEFTMKAWQLITHSATSPTYRRLGYEISNSEKGLYGSFQPTHQVWSAWDETREIALALGAWIILFQCPASFGQTEGNIKNLREFFSTVDREEFVFCWEPRGKWEAGQIKKICRELDLVDCVDPFKRQPAWGDLLYFRLHGKTGYRYRYTDSDLEELKRMVSDCDHCYVLFNNISMAEDAQRFLEIL